MPTRVLTLTALLFIAAYIPVEREFDTFDARLPSERLLTPSPTPPEVPDLDTLKDPECNLDGAAQAGSPQAQMNQLMNRYHLPTKFEEVPLEYLHLNLPQGEITPAGKFVNFPTWQDPNNHRAITVVGYVTAVRILGCGTATKIFSVEAPPQGKGVESANCYVNKVSLCPATILVTPDPRLSRSKGRNIYAMKVTRRSRLLAKGGYLVSNIGNDWSTTKVLRKKLVRRWVRLSGWLFFSENFRERAWASDPADNIGKPNERQTAWGIHPVMGIEVVPRPQ